MSEVAIGSKTKKHEGLQRRTVSCIRLFTTDGVDSGPDVGRRLGVSLAQENARFGFCADDVSLNVSVAVIGGRILANGGGVGRRGSLKARHSGDNDLFVQR